MIWQKIKAFDWGFYLSTLLDGGIAAFLAYLLGNFVWEIHIHKVYLAENWALLSIEQQYLANTVLCLQDSLVVFTVIGIILFVKLRR